VLTTDTETEVVADTTMGSDLSQAGEILAQSHVEVVSEQLRVGVVSDVLLSVKEPLGDAERQGVLDDLDDLVNLSQGELSGTLVLVNLSALADLVRETETNSLNPDQGEHHSSATVYVSVKDTAHKLELSFRDDKSLRLKMRTIEYDLWLGRTMTREKSKRSEGEDFERGTKIYGFVHNRIIITTIAKWPPAWDQLCGVD
jgi:hypothetical protein